MKHSKKLETLCEHHGLDEALAMLHGIKGDTIDDRVAKLWAVYDAERKLHESRVRAGLGGES